MVVGELVSVEPKLLTYKEVRDTIAKVISDCCGDGGLCNVKLRMSLLEAFIEKE